MAGQLTCVRFTILNGATASNEQDMRAYKLVALYVPTLTGTAITFTSRPETAVTTRSVRDSAGAATSITVASNQYQTLTGAQKEAVWACAYLTIVSGSAEGADRAIIGICEPRGF